MHECCSCRSQELVLTVATVLSFIFFLYTDDEFQEVPPDRLYATSALAYCAILFLVLTIVVTLYNSYQTVLRWWCGPGAIYTLSFFAGTCKTFRGRCYQYINHTSDNKMCN